MGFTLLINVVHWGYNSLTNHLLTSWDIKEGGSWPQISTHGPGPQNHLRCRYCVRSHASPPSWSPSSLEFESGIRIGNAPRGWKIADSVDDHWKLDWVGPHLLTLILAHCRKRVIVQVWVNFDRTICFFFERKIERNTLSMVHVCAEIPRRVAFDPRNPSAPAASRYANSYQKETAPRPSRTCQREATKVNQHPQNFLGQGDTKLSFFQNENVTGTWCFILFMCYK